MSDVLIDFVTKTINEKNARFDALLENYAAVYGAALNYMENRRHGEECVPFGECRCGHDALDLALGGTLANDR